MSFEPLSGIVPAPLTPMNPDFSIDWTSLESYIDWIAAARPTAIAMNMAAGEGPSLYHEEHLEVIRVCKTVIAGRARLFSGLIARNTEEAVSHGRALKAAGAEGFAVFPPFPAFLGNPVPTEMVYQFHKAIGDGVGLPMVLFQFPKAFGPDYPPETIRRVAEIPQVVALKEAAFDQQTCAQTIATVRALPRRIGILTGSDTVILESMQMGCNGALIGFAGTATDQLVAMNDAVSKGDAAAAEAIWARLGPLARFLWRAPLRDYRPRMKELLRMQGRIAHSACRPPQLGISDAERAEIRRLATEAKLLG
jgi:4-hydroxy-tetrahydrodipicolinate synthase